MIKASIQSRYNALLRNHVLNPDEINLVTAAQLGRELVMEDIPIEEIAEIHEKALILLADEFPDMTLSESLHLISAPFMEMLIAHSLVFRERAEAKKAAIEALRENEENLRTTLNSIGDAVITTDLSGNITRINPIAEKLTGWKFEEAKGKPLTEIFKIINERTREPVANPISTVLDNRQIVGPSNHTILISRHGVEYNISESTSPIKDTFGNITGLVLVFHDITEQLKTKESLFNTKKLESIGLLAGGIAHDFNNILAGLFGNIELAKMKLPKGHEAYTYIDTANQALEKATHLTKQLLTFAKGGAPILQAIDLKQVVENSTTFILSGSNIKAHFNLPENLWQIKADKGQISQVIAKLTINAKEAMPEGGNLYIEAENIEGMREKTALHLPGDFVKISIRDEGIGIFAKHIDKIFDPYFSTKQTGSGLGLATAHSIIIKHNGYISVDSTHEVGTTFTIHLPAERPSDKISIPTYPEMSEKPALESRHILVMDDDEMIRDMSVAMIESFGCIVDCAVDGKQAIEEYIVADKNGNPFDIVIMDLTIPGGMGGKEALKELLGIDPGAKVIVSSGYSNDPVMADYRKYGFSGRLVKPFKLEELKKELSSILNCRYRSPGTTGRL